MPVYILLTFTNVLILYFRESVELEKELDEATEDAEELANLIRTKSQAIKTLQNKLAQAKKTIAEQQQTLTRKTRKKVSMEIMLKKIEGYVFNIYLYHVSLKAFITNLEVVITISTDSLPTDYQQTADRSLPLWKNLSADSWPSVGRQLANSRWR